MPCNRRTFAYDVKEKSKRNGFRHSIFSTHWYPKDKYVGQWRNDKKEGKGIEIYRYTPKTLYIYFFFTTISLFFFFFASIRNGYVHQGQWINGTKQGFGLLSKITHEKCPESRELLHLGCWCRGEKHGYALHWYADSFYKGYFANGKKSGYGQMWWYSGQYYEGFWENDRFHGKGTLYLSNYNIDIKLFIFFRMNYFFLINFCFFFSANCNMYEGQFVDGKKNGYGIYYHKNTGQIQYGYWTDDVCTNSTIEDAYFRQSATRPTPYPLTKIPQ